MTSSTYFNKHYDVSMMKQQYQVHASAHLSIDEMANSMIDDLRENHFDAETNI